MSCRITLKSGEVFDLDLSATRVKHMKRSKVSIAVEGMKGERVIKPSDIKSISSLSQV